MRSGLIALISMVCWMTQIAWASEPEDTEISFETRTSRLIPGATLDLDRVAERMRARPASRLLVLVPARNDPGSRQFLASRLAVVDRELSKRGMVAVRVSASGGETGENELRLRIVPPPFVDSPRSSLPVSLVPTVADPPTKVSRPPADLGGVRAVVTAPGIPGTDLSVPTSSPAPPVKVEELWLAAAGRSLQEVLKAWADKAGWTLIWQSDREYPIDASASFSGDFTKAASQLCEGFSTVAPAPFAHFYKGNQVLVILSGEGR